MAANPAARDGGWGGVQGEGRLRDRSERQERDLGRRLHQVHQLQAEAAWAAA